MYSMSISILFVFFTYISINTDPSKMQDTYKYILASILEGSITTFVEVFLLFTWRRIFNIVQ